MPSGVYDFFGSFVFGTPGFPLSDVPLQEIAADAACGRLDVKPVRVFRFEEIVRRTGSWRPMRPAERWSWSTTEVQGRSVGHAIARPFRDTKANTERNEHELSYSQSVEKQCAS